MKSIELKELRSETLGELEVIQKTAEAEENRDLTEEENATVDALLAKADDYASKIERAEKIEKSLRDAAKVSGASVQTINTEKTTRGVGEAYPRGMGEESRGKLLEELQQTLGYVNAVDHVGS